MDFCLGLFFPFKLVVFPWSVLQLVIGKTLFILRIVQMHLIPGKTSAWSVPIHILIFIFSLYWHIVRKSISWCYSVKRSPLYLVSVPADPPIQDSRSSHSLFHPEDDFYPQAGLNQKTDFSLSSWAEPPPQWPSSISIKNWSSVFWRCNRATQPKRG